MLSKPQAILVNWLAASQLVTQSQRRRLLNLAGMSVSVSAHMRPGITFPQTADVTVGDDCYVAEGCIFAGYGPFTIGDASKIGVGSRLLSNSHDYDDPTCRAGVGWTEPIVIGKGCWIGAAVVILPGITLGDGCIVAAGATVIRDCEPHSLYGGVPARLIKTLEH